MNQKVSYSTKKYQKIQVGTINTPLTEYEATKSIWRPKLQLEEVRGHPDDLRYPSSWSCFNTKPYEGQKVSKIGGEVFSIIWPIIHIVSLPSARSEIKAIIKSVYFIHN